MGLRSVQVGIEGHSAAGPKARGGVGGREDTSQTDLLRHGVQMGHVALGHGCAAGCARIPPEMCPDPFRGILRQCQITHPAPSAPSRERRGVARCACVACSALGGSGGAPRVVLLGRGSSFPLPPRKARDTHTASSHTNAPRSPRSVSRRDRWPCNGTHCNGRSSDTVLSCSC